MAKLSRRTLLSSAGLIAAAPFASNGAFAMSEPPKSKAGGMQFGDPQHNLDAMIRLKGGADNRTRYFYGEGRAFAVFEDELAIPLFDAKAIAWERNKKQSDGSYIRQTSFVQYHYDIDGGSPDEWLNPVTGKTTKLPVFKNEFGEVRFTTRGPITPPEMNVKTLHGDDEVVHPWIILDDDVWLASEDMASYFSAREQRQQIENAVRCYHCSLSDLNDLSMASVPATLNETAASALFAFLDMPKDKHGYMLWRFVAKKYDTAEELPAKIRQQVDENNPELWNTDKS